ncbi:JmjC domain-containing protein [Chloropicon primus]|uniref:JmjC domain-containing protein n=1 Tax=Chloropicon primus TaxID=1764295 RepID=A0A7S2WX42_9CHLO|nr:JmjC domain-containing protein [Chloropicon primus]|mmetsp:Transcript_11950/g.33024  ORF Transcript_11950/g.33024 Transcript_11950/m.33024 type:complete len:495 (+) Transcript_11950:122-1606(+)
MFLKEEKRVSKTRTRMLDYDHDHDDKKERGWRRGSVFPYIASFALIAVLAWYGSAEDYFTWLPEVEQERLTVVPIPRIKSDSIGSTKEFFDKYGDQVVIVENEVRHHPASKLGWQGLKDLCGGGTVHTNLYDPNSTAWGGQTDHVQMLLGEYLDKYIIGESEELRYVGGDTGMPEFCPSLEFYAPIPRYVALALSPMDGLLVNHDENCEASAVGCEKAVLIGQPETFIGRPGTMTELHMDAWLVPFWMSVYIGRKTFRTIRYEDSRTHLNYYRKFARAEKRVYDNSTGTYVTKQLEIFNPDLEVFPELENVKVYEGTVNAGDWIYLPPATLHAVYNDEMSWALSANSLYPALLDSFVDTCVDAGFAANCATMVKERTQCQGEIETPQDLRSCLVDHPYFRKLMSRYENGESRDMLLHETHDFPDFSSWCNAARIMVASYEKQYSKSFSEYVEAAKASDPSFVSDEESARMHVQWRTKQASLGFVTEQCKQAEMV